LCIGSITPEEITTCTGSPCKFVIGMRWKLPTGEGVDLCNSWDAKRHCVEPPPVADGTDQSLDYTMRLGCEAVQHRLSASGGSPCGQLLASLFISCTKCEE
jgi:hypothetical protein